ncbi:glycosyltransferase [Aerosakkonemataceae cyanobacterium BLCC-F154]|uniref:Glycosyltransferase n=1 Tax=Floridaenema fluviatile BLCC-F154 TaxID=3153640 RepID=A0ABV4YDL7_9CYAN
MNNQPILTIVTPTIGKFSNYWLEQLLKIQGNVEFVLVYYPSVPIPPINDPRVKILTSPYKGEMMQRFVGLLNATGKYVLALDDDDFVHPDVVHLTTQYFEQFPESWILRLKKENIDFRDQELIRKDWDEILDVRRLEICKKTPENPYPYQQGNYKGLLEIPVVPLGKKLDLKFALLPFTGRKDNLGYHFENFNNIVWKNKLVQQALVDLSQTTRLLGAITWIPSSGFDRLLGLFIQAKYYQKDAIIGHCMPKPEQIRYVDKPPELKPPRFHVISDALLVKRYPQYGYLWNLFLEKLYGVPRTMAKALKWRLLKK